MRSESYKTHYKNIYVTLYREIDVKFKLKRKVDTDSIVLNLQIKDRKFWKLKKKQVPERENLKSNTKSEEKVCRFRRNERWQNRL
jgi:hypothetical protein